MPDEIKLFRDFVEINAFSPSNESYQRFKDNNGSKLDVVARLSFAGYKTRNKMVYLPTEFDRTISHWTKPYNKPVQKHHEDHADPIGRIISVKYVDTSKDWLSNPAVKTLISSHSTLEEKLDAIEGLWAIQKTNDEFMGLGHFLAHLEITDSDAAQKFIDGRFKTLSAGYMPEKVYCPICHKDVMQRNSFAAFFGEEPDEDECTHQPGQVDKETGKTCFWVPTGQRWDEVSVVNQPASEYCQTVSIGTSQLDSKLDKSNTDSSEKTDLVILYSVKDSYYSMADDRAFSLKDMTNMLGFSKGGEKEGNTVIDVEEGAVKLADSIPQTEEELCDYVYLAGILEEMGMGDKVLTAKARKKLGAKTFCGPDRSFPVPDCAHVTAARRLIGRYKGPGSKSAILACVNKKAKSLGCDKKDEEMSKLLESMKDSKENYVMLSKYIPEAERLDETALAAVEDSVFLGSGRTFLAKDLTHAKACAQLLAEFIDEKDAEFFKVLDQAIDVKIQEFSPAEPEKPVDSVNVEPEKEVEPRVDEKQKKIDELTAQLVKVESDHKVEVGVYVKRISDLENDVKALDVSHKAAVAELRDLLSTTIGQLLETNEKNENDKLSMGDLKKLFNDKVSALKTKPKEAVVPGSINASKIEDVAKKSSAVPIASKETKEKYAGIYNQYIELKLRNEGLARHYLVQMKADGFLPHDVNFE